MHGRKRTIREENDPKEVRDAKIEKYRTYIQGSRQVLSIIKQMETNPSAENDGIMKSISEKAEKLLRYNPDFFTLWNSRRRTLLKLIESGTLSETQLLEQELELTQFQIMERNSKSYGAWYHRRWCIEHFGARANFNFEKELKLCDLLLTKDERNFHCWGHRNFLIDFMQKSSTAPATTGDMLPPQEGDFTKSTQLIHKNFSNYSAWHLRVKTLLEMENKGQNFQDWNEEFELVHQAIFTEPADQSAWLYLRWLLSKDHKEIVNIGRIRNEIEIILTLLEEEGDCKWPLLALVQLYTRLAMIDDVTDDEEVQNKGLNVCERITTVDSMHEHFYQFLSELFRTKQYNRLRKVLFC
jgi:geranylgeranyl transferase type-2 subunit alpha